MDATNFECLSAEGLTAQEIDVWQVGSGFNNSALFFDSEVKAKALSLSEDMHSSHMYYKSRALRLSDGRILLCSEPIVVHSSASEMLRRNALKKLTDGEKEALGLLGDTEAAHE